MIQRVGKVAYELELLEECKINNVFHVSYVKNGLRQQITISA